MFHGNKLLGAGMLLSMLGALGICLSSIRGKLNSEILRWEKEKVAVDFQLADSNRHEILLAEKN